jgi:hypothetical protein
VFLLLLEGLVFYVLFDLSLGVTQAFCQLIEILIISFYNLLQRGQNWPEISVNDQKKGGVDSNGIRERDQRSGNQFSY